MADSGTLPKFKYKLHRLSDYDVIPATESLVDPWLPLGAQIVLAALPKTLKTYVALSFACCVATGHKWLGQYPVKKARVLYIALESYHGVLRRKEAWRKRHGFTKADLDNLACITVPINFAQESSIYDAGRDLIDQGFRPDLVIIDTWFKSTAGANVSDQAEMTDALDRLTVFKGALEQADEFRDALLPHVTVLIIAHTDKKGADLFGSIAQFANCDVLYMLNRKEYALEVTLSCVGARDIEEPPVLIIGLEKVFIETAKGAEENIAVTKAMSVLDSILNQKASEVAPDHDLAVKILGGLGPAGFNQWYEAMKAKRGGNLSTSDFNPIVKDLLKTNSVTKDPSATNEWTDAAGKRHKSDGLYRVASQVVPEGVPEGVDQEIDSPLTSTLSLPPKGGKVTKVRSEVGEGCFEVTSKSRSSNIIEETKSRNVKNLVVKDEQPETDEAFQGRVLAVYESLDHPQAKVMLEARAAQNAAQSKPDPEPTMKDQVEDAMRRMLSG
jgi:hypothetical protein